MAVKYAYGNGDPGCLFDHVEGPFDTEAEAIQAACELFDTGETSLTEAEQDALASDGIVYFRGRRKHELGAGLIEIFEVDDDWEAG